MDIDAQGRNCSRPCFAAPHTWVISILHEKRTAFTDAGFKAMWNRVQVKWAESGGERFTFHDIRAKALTDAKRQGLDAQALAGHTSSATTDHYIKLKEFRKVTPLL